MQINKTRPIIKTICDYLIAIPALLMLFTGIAYSVDFEKYPEAAELVDVLVEQTGLDREMIESIVREADFKEDIIEAITRPAEKKFPWYRYKPIFIYDEGIELGVQFWDKHEETLARAQEEYGVHPSIIVAIIGVETRYGRITGRHRVIDSQVTIALGYPRRSEFFTKQLGEFLQLCAEEGLDPLKIKGSYAGAMGIPQFISSSYRVFAVDFNSNGRRDLLTETDDAIGSVGNYLEKNGWIKGGPVYADLESDNSDALKEISSNQLKPERTYGELEAIGAKSGSRMKLGSKQKLGVIEYETEPDVFIYRAGLPNFYAITTYNRSTLYAMAVAELAEHISEARLAKAEGS